MPDINCAICDKSFYIKPSKVGLTKCCSMACGGKLRGITIKGEGNPKWKGGEHIRWDGRVVVYAPDHPNACLFGGKYILRSRLVMSKKLGRPLKDSEIVHHINGMVDDDRPNNLGLFGSQSVHCKAHPRERNEKGQFI